MEKHNFSSPSPEENTVFGASRPGYPSKKVPENVVNSWINFMKSENIERVCCLLEVEELKKYYNGLTDIYKEEFGSESVAFFPIKDHSTVKKDKLYNEIFPFLEESKESSSKTVVHCSAGLGRTGHILTLWLVYRHDYELDEAILKLESTGRYPLESKNKEDLREIVQGN